MLPILCTGSSNSFSFYSYRKQEKTNCEGFTGIIDGKEESSKTENTNGQSLSVILTLTKLHIICKQLSVKCIV